MCIIKKAFSLLLVFSLLAACAKRPDNIQAQYVSPQKFEEFDCGQIDDEIKKVFWKLDELSDYQDTRATSDAWVVATSIMLWPFLFALLRDDHESEIARLKGDYKSLITMAEMKDCQKALVSIADFKNYSLKN